ncbi:MAG: hypothetical protein KF791_17680 [Verrucomicrobiae bacterium]|nr:hypothetical protein [Verrucomicrobiae bacterium]
MNTRAFKVFRLLIAAGGLVLGASAAVEETPAAPELGTPQAPEKVARFLELFVGGYQVHGRRDPKWDPAALSALKQFADARSGAVEWTTESGREMVRLARAALDSGCPDPLVQYIHWRRGDRAARALINITEIASSLEASGYDPLLKSYGHYWAYEALHPAPRSTPPSAQALRALSDAMARFREALERPGFPENEFEDLGRSLAAQLNTSALVDLHWPAVETLLVSRHGDSAAAQLFLGDRSTTFAWTARGGGWASDVTETGWRLFETRLSTAETALRNAWRLDPSLPTTPERMIWVCIGRGHNRREMELWFQRGRNLTVGSYELHHGKATYLMPKWHGSIKEVLEFGRQCLTEPGAAGRPRLTLVDIHEELERCSRTSAKVDLAYFREPVVWREIRSSFEAFFKDQPEAVGWHHNFALHAWRAQDWAVLNAEIPKLGSKINFKYFGGQDAYEQMLADAAAHAAR